MHAEAQRSPVTSDPRLEAPHPVNISLPAWALELLEQDAARKGISPEHWAQLIILQRMDKMRVAP